MDPANSGGLYYSFVYTHQCINICACTFLYETIYTLNKVLLFHRLNLSGSDISWESFQIYTYSFVLSLQWFHSVPMYVCSIIYITNPPTHSCLEFFFSSCLGSSERP